MNWELSISVVSLVISIASIFYAYFNKKIDLDIIETWYDVENEPTYICFTVVNSSDSSVPLNKITLYKDTQVIVDNGFLPEIYSFTNLDAVRYSNPFQEKEYLAPFQEISYSYYVGANEIPNRIDILSSKRLTFTRKKKSFSPIFISH